MEYETIDTGQIDQIMAGKNPGRQMVGAMMISLKAVHLMPMLICEKHRLLMKSQANLRRATRRRLANRDSKSLPGRIWGSMDPR